MRLFILGFVWALPTLALAEADPVPDTPDAAHEATLAAIRDNRDRFLSLATDAINGYGGPGGLTAEVLEGAIALERADARASLMRRFLEVDLNNDGDLTPDEVSVAADAASASARARLMRLIERADGDGDGRISSDEIALQAEEAALKALPETEAQALRGLLRFDADGNGLVTMEEARIGIASVVGDDGA